MITLRQIQFALAVAEHKHFKRAAEDCNVSQSALSLGISEMEKSLGVVIFERNNKQVVVTPIGKELIERAQKIFLDTQQLIERAHAGQKDLGFGMKIGFIPTVAPYYLPILLPILQEKFPKFEMTVVEKNSELLINMVETGQLDAAIIALPYDTTGLEVSEIGDENFFVLVHEDHSLSKENKINPLKLKKQSLMLLGDEHCLHDHIMDICKFQRNIGQDIFRDAHLNTLIQLTLNNIGITLIPEMALNQIRIYPELKQIPLDVPTPHRTLAIITRPNYPRAEDMNLLLTLFKQALEQSRAK